MPLSASIKIPMGTLMPSFDLCDLHGKYHKSDDLAGTLGSLVIFACNHCPYTQVFWSRLVRIAKHAKCLGINTVLINPNAHCQHAENTNENVLERSKELMFDFPCLLDETQAVAKSFQAQCTPEVFLYDQHKKLVYHGRIDNSWDDESKVTSSDLKLAVDALASGQPVERRQISAVGSPIQWLAS